MCQKDTILIQNDSEAMFKYVDGLGSDIARKFDQVLQTIMSDITARGYEMVATLLSNHTDFVFWAEEPGEYADHELVYLHVFVPDENGEPNCDKFVVIDVTTREVEDCSKNIITRH